MSIRVTCAGCHTRFNVDDRFAGKEGPCPKCKKPITIPAKSEAVQVHAPDQFGPKTTSGEGALKPITRRHAKLSPVQMVLIAATIVGFLVVAFLMRSSIKDPDSFNSWLLLLGAVLLAVPCVYGGYSFLRNAELGAFIGNDLIGRIAACSVTYGLSWLAIPLVSYAIGPELGRFIGVALMVVLGVFTAYLLLSLDFIMGTLHYGMFFGCCVLLRVTAGFTALPYPEASTKKMDDILNDQGASLLLDSFLETCRLFV